MALGDVVFYDQGAFGNPGSDSYVVSASTTIYAGEPVVKALGSNFVTALATGAPLVGTDYMAGIAATSTGSINQTLGTSATVGVYKMSSQNSFLCSPNDATQWNTQSKYNALIGKRVLWDLTGTSYTVLHTDSANNGLVVEPLEIAKFPGKVRFSIRNAVNYLA